MLVLVNKNKTFRTGYYLTNKPLLNSRSALKVKCQFKSEQLEAPASEARIDATAQGIASMLCAHGPEVEWLICTIWEARPSPSQFLRNRLTRNRRGNSTSTPHSFPVPILSPLKSLPVPPAWQPVRSMPHKNLCGDGRSLRRTFPIEASTEHSKKSKGSMWSTTKNLPVAELRTMINSLSLESSASMALLDCSFLCWPSLKCSVWFTTFQHSLGDRVLLSLFEKGDLSNSHYV